MAGGGSMLERAQGAMACAERAARGAGLPGAVERAAARPRVHPCGGCRWRPGGGPRRTGRAPVCAASIVLSWHAIRDVVGCFSHPLLSLLLVCLSFFLSFLLCFSFLSLCRSASSHGDGRLFFCFYFPSSCFLLPSFSSSSSHSVPLCSCSSRCFFVFLSFFFSFSFFIAGRGAEAGQPDEGALHPEALPEHLRRRVGRSSDPCCQGGRKKEEEEEE